MLSDDFDKNIQAFDSDSKALSNLALRDPLFTLPEANFSIFSNKSTRKMKRNKDVHGIEGVERKRSHSTPTEENNLTPPIHVKDYVNNFTMPYALPSTKEWSTAVLLSVVSPDQIIKITTLLLMEKSLVIVGDNVTLVSTIAFAVTNLIAPFTWEGVFVPLIPDNARELFEAPVPFILGE
jgi:hypothetical protein